MSILDELMQYKWDKATTRDTWIIFRNNDPVAKARRTNTGWLVTLKKLGHRRPPKVFDFPLKTMDAVDLALEDVFSQVGERYERKDIGVKVNRRP